MPDFYPEEALEAHGLTPDTWHTAGCYALALDPPRHPGRFVEKWAAVYDVDPPEQLAGAAAIGLDCYYVGATGNLRERLSDHVDGDVRRVKLLAVCPPTEVVAVWPDDSFEDAADHERGHAYALRDDRDGAVVWCNGEIV